MERRPAGSSTRVREPHRGPPRAEVAQVPGVWSTFHPPVAAALPEVQDVIDVNGPRPAMSWVSELPLEWTTTRERLVLTLLALDTYSPRPPFWCSPSLVELARAAGEYKGRIVETIDSLAKPTHVRPALVERVPGAGRRRSAYRLIIEPEFFYPDHNDDLWSVPADRNGSGSWSAAADHYDTRSGPARGPRRGPGSGPPQRTTPYPKPNPSSHSSAQPPVPGARADGFEPAGYTPPLFDGSGDE